MELSYRREWYDGAGADDGSPRDDEEVEFIMSLTKPLRSNVRLKSKFEVEDHKSNRSSSHYLETKAKIALEVSF